MEGRERQREEGERQREEGETQRQRRLRDGGSWRVTEGGGSRGGQSPVVRRRRWRCRLPA